MLAVVHATSQSAFSHGKELYNTNNPSASLVTVIRIIRIRVRVPRVAATTIRGRGPVEEKHYGVCTTFAAAAANCPPRTSLLVSLVPRPLPDLSRSGCEINLGVAWGRG